MDRRTVLGGMVGGVAASILSGSGFGSSNASAAGSSVEIASTGRRRSSRIVHMTDLHIQPERGAADGVVACLKHVGAMNQKPDLIVTGGDLIMDAFEQDETRTKLQWELFNKAFRDHASAKVTHTLGNHDIWGWNKSKSKTIGNEKGWGKSLALETLGLDKAYRAIDLGDWQVIVLDSAQVDPFDANGYVAFCDPEQMDWLRTTLRSTPAGKHTLVVSHIPIMSIVPLSGKPGANLRREISGGTLHTDSEDLVQLFDQTKTVRACVSGHLHRLDRCEFRDVTYLCSGAVCGSWWEGAHHEAFEGYSILDLMSDGSVERQYVGYGWKAIG